MSLSPLVVCAQSSHVLFMRLAEVGQRVGLARRRRLLTLGLQASGRTYRGVCRQVRAPTATNDPQSCSHWACRRPAAPTAACAAR
jgi:hypothetical protein